MLTIGLFTDSLQELSFEQMLDWCQAHGIEALEFGTGNFSSAPHIRLSELLGSVVARENWLGAIAARGLRISALNCSGNLLDADRERRERSQKIYRDSVLLSEMLGLETLVVMSGCPGEAGDTGHFPNWVTTTWQPEYPVLLERQWRTAVIPFWKDAARLALDHGVRLAFEMHPGQVVYNPRTLVQLLETCGENIGVNLDPSHLFWQGIEPLNVVQAIGDLVFHFHAKDCRIDATEMALNGGLETRVTGKRAWVHCSPGEGHVESYWRELVSTLLDRGYDGALSIEYESSPERKNERLQNTIAILSRARHRV